MENDPSGTNELSGPQSAGARSQVRKRVCRELPFGVRYELAIGIADEPDHRPASAGEVRSRGQPGLVLPAVAAIGLAPGPVDLDAVKLGLELEIDDAGERIRAIHRGGAPGDDLDAVNERWRDDVDVGDAVAVRGHQPFPVEEYQRRRGTKAAQGKVGLPTVEIKGTGMSRDELGERVDGRLDGAGADSLEQLLRYRDDRTCRVEVRARDAGAGDEDLLGSCRAPTPMASAGSRKPAVRDWTARGWD